MAHLKQKIQIQADFFVIWEFTIFPPGIFARYFFAYDFPLTIFPPAFHLRFFRPQLNFPTKPYFAMLL